VVTFQRFAAPRYVASWLRTTASGNTAYANPRICPGDLRGGWFHDFLGSWGEDDMRLWLRYYASDEERAKHAADWPKDAIPPKEKPPFNRDWRLPKGPF
jgi:hypothetical protein